MNDAAHLDLALVAPGVASSDPSLDDQALCVLDALLAQAERHGVSVGLYHHVNTWLERLEDGVRLCRMLDHPRLGVTFCGYHWYAVDGRSLQERVLMAAPHLSMANLCGSSRRADNAESLPTVEPLDSGELDNFAVLGALSAAGFDGWVGVQGFSIGGDVHANLTRSIAALRALEARVRSHPDWAVMRDDR